MASFSWQDQHGTWTPYTDVVNEKLERRYQRISAGTHHGRMHVNIVSAGRKYQITVGPGPRMSQRNVGTGGTRTVKRVFARRRDLEWTCSACSYHVTSGADTCTICGTARTEVD